MEYSKHFIIIVVSNNILMYTISMKTRLLLSAIPKATVTDEKLVNFINENFDRIRSLNSSQMAQEADVSQSSVIKFSQKLGYPSYKRMILDLSSDQPDDLLDDILDFKESTPATMAKLSKLFENCFEITSSLNPAILFEKAAKLIIYAPMVSVYSYSSRQTYLAHYLFYDLLRIGIPCQWTDNYTQIVSQTLISKPNDVVIILSKSGETREMLNTAKIIKQNGGKVISLTRTQKNSLAKISDINFKTIEYRDRSFIREKIVTQSFLFLIDMIVLSVVKLQPEKSQQFVSFSRIRTKPNYIEKL